jgi:uncharacterized YigZ family protein
MTASFRTIKEPATIESVTGRSRFIAHCRRADSETEARAFVAEVRTEHPNATHNCYAYRIGAGPNPLEYYSDHGEPSGTAGKPILGAICRLELVNVVVVVTRYFGGKKLGVRGLIEAYGRAATAALEQAGSLTVIPLFRVKLVCDYAAHETLLHRLRQIEAVVETVEFGEAVNLLIAIPQTRETEWTALLAEFPSLQITCLK